MFKRDNMDLGRNLTFDDIPGNHTYPIDPRDSGGVYCYDCRADAGLCDSGLVPLTQSTGVFTSLVLCGNDAPVYLCLGHMPLSSFTPEVAEVLRGLGGTYP